MACRLLWWAAAYLLPTFMSGAWCWEPPESGGSQHHAPTPPTLGIQHAASLLCCAVRFVIGLCGSDILGKPYSSMLINTQKSDRRTRLLAGLRPREARFPQAAIGTSTTPCRTSRRSTAFRISVFADRRAVFFSKLQKANGELPLLVKRPNPNPGSKKIF